MGSDSAIHMGVADDPMASAPACSGLLSCGWPVRVQSFGPLNPDKIFYVVWRKKGAGLFSILTSTLCQLDIADRLGFTPVVDMEHFESQYNEDHPIEGTRNSWEYYFRQVSPYTLDEVYQSKTVVICDGDYPAGYPFLLSEAPGLAAVYQKYCRLHSEVLQYVNRFDEQHFAGSSVLGVHFRGTDMRVAPGHPFPPTPRQMIARAKALVADGGYDKVFIATEDKTYLELFKSVFGSRVICTDAFRAHDANAFQVYPRPDHKYLLGRDVLRDTLILARCSALLCSGSNVSEFAQFYNDGRYETVSRIDNGMNVSNGIIAKRLWFARSCLPDWLGGFSST